MTIRAAQCPEAHPAGPLRPPGPDLVRSGDARSDHARSGVDLGAPPGWVAAALERAEMRFVTQVVRDGGIGPWREQVTERFRVARSVGAGRGLSRADTAALVVALADRPVRDGCWLQVEEDRHVDWIALWRHLARHAQPP